jgi:hypothetical protein
MASPWSLDGDGAERTEGDGRQWRGECTPRRAAPIVATAVLLMVALRKGGFEEWGAA